MEFAQDFQRFGIDVNEGRFGSWVESQVHQGMSYQYARDWEAFLLNSSDPTAEQAFSFARELAGKYWFDVHF